MKLPIGGISLFLALSGLPAGAANAALDTGVQNSSISQQESTCKGVVKDSKGETIIGASVVVKGTSNGTITDFDGNFALSAVKKGATIQISFVGFKTQEFVWDGSPISVTLKEDTEVLEEVVVIGYGVQKKADLTGSVANVSAEKLNTHTKQLHHRSSVTRENRRCRHCFTRRSTRWQHTHHGSWYRYFKQFRTFVYRGWHVHVRNRPYQSGGY